MYVYLLGHQLFGTHVKANISKDLLCCILKMHLTRGIFICLYWINIKNSIRQVLFCILYY